MPEPIRESTASVSTAPTSISDNVIGAAGSGFGAIAQANKSYESYTEHAFEQPSQKSDTSRWEKFSNTFTGCVDGGAEMGAVAGSVATFLPDCLVGKGTATTTQYDPKSEGLIGLAAHAAVDSAAVVASVPGAIAGGVVGLVAGSVDTGAAVGAGVTSATTSTILSVPVGIVLGIARLPSLALKTGAMVVGAAVGGVAGFAAGLVRAIFNS